MVSVNKWPGIILKRSGGEADIRKLVEAGADIWSLEEAGADIRGLVEAVAEVGGRSRAQC